MTTLTDSALTFTHVFEPSTWLPVGEAPTLLLLHGTGGDENDLLQLGTEIQPEANLLSPRGKVLENGMPRFFRRLAEGVFDIEDLIQRTHELAEFVTSASSAYGFDANRVIAVGFSNGANIAASLLLLKSESLAGGVLLRAMVPLEPPTLPDLSGKRILLSEGRMDPLIPADNAERLAELLKTAGADVTLRWRMSGHGLTRDDVEDAKAWLREQ
jgi:predicted esterase